RLAEAHLRESEMRLQQAREAAGLGTLDYNPETRQLWCDARALAFWELRDGTTLTIDELFAAVHPDDVASARAAFDAALDPAGDGRYAAEFRVRSLRRDQERWVRMSGVRTTTTAGNPGMPAARLIMTVQDVSQPKAWEAQQ